MPGTADRFVDPHPARPYVRLAACRADGGLRPRSSSEPRDDAAPAGHVDDVVAEDERASAKTVLGLR